MTLLLIISLITGCQTREGVKSSKYLLLYSNDKTEGFDSSSFVYFDKDGKITNEDSFDGTLFKQLTQYDEKFIVNNGEKIVESLNGEIKTIKYKKQLKAYSSELESFEYKNHLFWFVHGGTEGVYNSHLYCYDTQKSLTMANGAVFGYLLDDNYVYVVMGNDWYSHDVSKNTAMKVVKIDLDKFVIENEFISDVDSDITMNLLEQGDNIFDKEEILFSISIPNDNEDEKRNPSYLYSFSLKDKCVKKILNLSQFGIDTGEGDTYFDSNSFVYNNAIYFFLRNGDLFRITQNKEYHVEKVLTLPDCSVGSICTMRITNNNLTCVYRKNTSEFDYSLVEYNLDSYKKTNDIKLEKVYSLLCRKWPIGLIKL